MTGRRTSTIGAGTLGAGLSVLLAVVIILTGPMSGRAGVHAAPRSTASASPTAGSSTPGSSTPGSSPAGSSAPGPTAPATPPAVLAPAAPTSVDAETLADRVAAAASIDDTTVGAAVWSAASGRWVYDDAADTALIPASTNKLLTCAAALQLLGPMHRFTTRVVTAATSVTPGTTTPGTATPGTPTPGTATATIVLVGGGDPYLAGSPAAATIAGQASLQALADRTATRLHQQQQTTIRLGYDASLFTGPAWNPHWPKGYATSVTPTSALWVDEGRADGYGHRQQDPAAAAARLFAAQLRAKGVRVTAVAATAAPPAAPTIASIPSLPLSRIVERLLMTSDNDAAEVVLRQTAIGAGRPGSIADGVQAVRQTLTGLGVWPATAQTYDGSGLARANHLPPRMLVDVLRLAVSGVRPALAPLLTGLPVAGVEGSLQRRFGDPLTTPGRGLVRAKTGTLHGVRSLAGYVYTRDGELLIFALILNRTGDDHHRRPWGQRAVTWLDRTATAAATCGCRR